MTFGQITGSVPDGFRTDEIFVRALRRSDAALDHEAVMETRVFLRKWEQSAWPEDDFTVEANRADVEAMEQRHLDGVSFTYTVLDPSEAACLGCVYVFPLDAPFLARCDVELVAGAPWAEASAAIYFWVRQSGMQDGLDSRLLHLLLPWLSETWRFEDPLFVTNEQVPHQVSLLERAGLGLRYTLADPKAPGRFLAFGKAGCRGWHMVLKLRVGGEKKHTPSGGSVKKKPKKVAS